MEGYVVNNSPKWAYALKRDVGPGAKIMLSELYTQYGEKYGLKPDEEFLTWLRDVKLKDRTKWRIVTDIVSTKTLENKKIDQNIDANSVEKGEYVAPMVKDKYSVADIVELSVRQARDILPKIKDVKLLQYSLTEANQLSGKDSLCRLIRNRIKDLQV